MADMGFGEYLVGRKPSVPSTCTTYRSI